MKDKSYLFNKDSLRDINEKNRDWYKNCYNKKLEREESFKTISGISIDPIYTPEDIAETDFLQDIGFPGLEPHVRGIHSTMYRGGLWTIRQLAGFGPPEESNKRIKFLLKEGATGINCVFDYPTLRGYDSSDPEAYADVGRGGVAIDTLDDMNILFDGISIENISTSLVTTNPICNITLQSMFFATARKRSIALNKLTGTNQNDFLMETAITIGPETLPPASSFKLSCDAIEYCTKNAPYWNPISFAGYNYRESGCNAIQEVAFAISNAYACCEELIRRGLDIDSFAPRLSFFMSSSNDFFEEIAKFRAARKIWSSTMKKRFGAKNPRSQLFRFHVQTSGSSLTAQQPLNNISRSAYHALSAILGGAQSVHIDGFDEALCTPTELSALTALRTSQILQMETGVTSTVDPLGGSYFVESLTNQIEKKILSLIDEIDQMGGIIKAVETGWLHREISSKAYEYQKSIESGETPLVGINCFRNENEELPIDLFEGKETLQIQGEKIKKIKKNRNDSDVQRALDNIARSCDNNKNLMEVIVDSVNTYITEREITNILKNCFGTWNPPLF